MDTPHDSPRPLTVDFQAREYLHAVQSANQRLLAPRRAWAVFVSALAVGAGFGLLMTPWGQAWAGSPFGIPALVVLVVAAIMGLQLLQRRALYRRLIATQPASYTLELTPEGIETRSERGHTCLLWSALEAIEVQAQGLHLHFRGFQVLWVPARLFAEPADYQAFVAHVQAASGFPASPPPLHITNANENATPLAGWLANLGAGFALLAFRREAIRRLHASAGQFIALAATTFALDLLGGWARIDGPALFNWMAIPATLLTFTTLLLTAWATARAEGLPDTSPRVLRGAVALLAPWTALALIASALTLLDLLPDASSGAAGTLLIWGLLLWAFLAMMVALARALELLPESRVGAGLAVIGLFAVPMLLTAQLAQLWVEDYRQDDDSAALRERWEAPAREAVLYAQPELLAENLAALQPSRPGVPDVYLLAIAGHGSQDVFKREVEAVEAQFARDFGTDGRSLALINNPATVEERPMATVTALKQALKTISQRMNKEEDVLFLFLTSHGSQDHKFDLSLYPYRLNDLTPEVLQSAIAEAGIGYRVVVVSACYSGGFIKALAAPEALVMTAARPDRNSHGCSHEADRTFFGRAYFDEALQETRSFRRAFDTALPRIAEREKAGQHTPSEPQIAEGTRIGPILQGLETYWSRHAATPASQTR